MRSILISVIGRSSFRVLETMDSYAPKIYRFRYLGWLGGQAGGSHTVSDINRKSIGMKSGYLRGSPRDIIAPFSTRRDLKNQ